MFELGHCFSPSPFITTKKPLSVPVLSLVLVTVPAWPRVGFSWEAV